MVVLDPGHKYLLTELDIEDVAKLQTLTFVKREGKLYPGNVGHHQGTTTQEVLRALIDRIVYVNRQIYDNTNIALLHHLRESIWYLEYRAARRHGRAPLDRAMIGVIETLRTCSECGHIGCQGECRHGS